MWRKTCCFTGHRNLPKGDLPEIRDRTAEVVRKVVATGVCFFGVGGAIGYDTLAAEVLFQLREEEFPHIKVILVYPFEGFTSRWTDEQKAVYARLLPKYDKRVCVAPVASREAYLARDRHLVDNSSCCICYCTRQTGGTAYTVRYAKKRGLKIYNVAGQIGNEVKI